MFSNPVNTQKSDSKEARNVSFLGSAMHSMDAKKRVIIPSKYREDLGNVFYVTRKFDPCLAIYTEEEWASFLDKLEKLPDSVAADAQEYLLCFAQKCIPDSSGRIILEDKLLEHAHIKKNLVFVGAGRQLKIWSEELWEEREKNRECEKMRAVLQDFGL